MAQQRWRERPSQTLERLRQVPELLDHFVEQQQGQWDHPAWLSLLERLRRAGFDPLDEAQVRALLEERREAWRERQRRATPPPQPPPGREEARRGWLSPANPFHWLVLLWWVLVRPDLLRQYRAGLDRDGQARLQRVGSWLSSTLTWGALLMGWAWVFLIFLPQTNEVVQWFLRYWAWIPVAVIGGWLATGRWGHEEIDMVGVVGGMIFGALVGAMVGMTVGVVGGMLVSVLVSVVFGVALGVALGVVGMFREGHRNADRVVGGVAVGVMSGMVFSVWIGVGLDGAGGVAVVVLFGVAVGAMVGVVLLASSVAEESICAGRPSWIGRLAFVALVLSWGILLGLTGWAWLK
jgi:hypothetical protein